MLGYRIITTRLGFVGFVAGPNGVRRVYLPARHASEIRNKVAQDEPGAREDNRLLPKLAQALARYFSGESADFSFPLDVSDEPEFHQRVYDACAKVRYGKTASYADLAAAVGEPRAARAVGTAMARNRIPIIIPCHRILRSDGGLGGYSGPGGTDFKRDLLEMERRTREAVVA